MEFVSAECQVQGNLVTLGFGEQDFSTQHHRFRGGRSAQLGLSYSNRAGNHTVPYRRSSSPFGSAYALFPGKVGVNKKIEV